MDRGMCIQNHCFLFAQIKNFTSIGISQVVASEDDTCDQKGKQSFLQLPCPQPITTISYPSNSFNASFLSTYSAGFLVFHE